MRSDPSIGENGGAPLIKRDTDRVSIVGGSDVATGARTEGKRRLGPKVPSRRVGKRFSKKAGRLLCAKRPPRAPDASSRVLSADRSYAIYVGQDPVAPRPRRERAPPQSQDVDAGTRTCAQKIASVAIAAHVQPQGDHNVIHVGTLDEDALDQMRPVTRPQPRRRQRPETAPPPPQTIARRMAKNARCALRTRSRRRSPSPFSRRDGRSLRDQEHSRGACARRPVVTRLLGALELLVVDRRRLRHEEPSRRRAARPAA